MNIIQSYKLPCPYCGETIELLVDCSADNQEYIEDCQVCCRPINISVKQDMGGDYNVILSHEND